jgi:hypothetical protein
MVTAEVSERGFGSRPATLAVPWRRSACTYATLAAAPPPKT